MPDKLKWEEVEERVIHHHGNFYSLHPESYVTATKEMKVTCPDHGDFCIPPERFCRPIKSSKAASGCILCRQKKSGAAKSITLKEFKERVEKFGSDNLIVDYATY